MSNSKYSLFFLVACLGFTSGLPASLFASTLQAWFVEAGASVFFVSSLGLISLVFFLRIFLAPLADKYFIAKLGRRKTWIIGTQVFMFICIEVMALFNPSESSGLVLLMAVFLAFLSCVQDLVIDAHRIEYLSSELYGFGAVIAIYACRLGLLLSGGGALIFANYYGFRITYACLGFLFLISALGVFFSQEPTIKQADEGEGPYKDFLRQPNLIAIMGLVFFIKFGEVFVANASPLMMPFMLQGLGLSLVKVAYVNKFFGLGAQLVGGVLAAVLIKRFSLMYLLLVFGSLEIIANLIFVVLGLFPESQTLLWTAVALENLASGLTSTALVVFLMRLVHPCFAATHYSLWIMFAILPRIIAGPLGGYISTHYGWSILFGLSSFLTSIFLIFWWKIRASGELNPPRKIVSKMMASS